MEEKKVCIVGAGVSGLAACKYLVQKGFHPVLFESDRVVGGVWARTLPSTRLQSSPLDYQYSDFPWPETLTKIFPDHNQVVEYLGSYARRFDLLKYVRFGEKVMSLDYVGAGEKEMEAWDMWSGNGEAFGGSRRGTWHVTVRKEDDGSCQVHIMDFVILCVGRYSGLLNIPSFPANKGPEAFNGEVIHVMDYCKMGSSAADKFLKGKRVTVVGFRKFALDVAAECANVNGPEYPCTMIIRGKHWNIPKFVAWGIPLHYFCLNRFSELFFDRPGGGLLLSILATMLSPLVWLFTKFTESYFKKIIPIKKYGMVPEHSFFQAMFSCLVCVLPENFYKKVEEGSIVLKHSKSFEFCKNGIIVEGDTSPINTDLMIFATGFKSDQKIKDLFISPHFQKIVIGSLDFTIPLYRECIHPRIPQLAIIGYSEHASNIYLSEMRARWLAHFINGGFLLPSINDMEKSVKEWDKYMKRYLGKFFRRSCITSLHLWYNDQLCKDLGCNPKRKKGFLAEWFISYKPTDYANLEEEQKSML
ncbi:hypothetical protein IEQ34_015335 [Dendrobium chrysotoxum]|uniref:Flavin-containing monooxygenase n=1 Tax=Dendrobium chrysotoxum TaxID=161865 RepID=A0AAV7GI45_DENCH|nr:hypothetical protein IEQ34_015335 [Dendrobium chrysotoxum]